MKVTDELWAAYVRACHERGLLFLPATVENEVRAALQAALDDVPEPTADADERVAYYKAMYRDVMALLKAWEAPGWDIRAKKAEAKLASLAELAEEWAETSLSLTLAEDRCRQAAVCARELRERLEGEP